MKEFPSRSEPISITKMEPSILIIARSAASSFPSSQSLRSMRDRGISNAAFDKESMGTAVVHRDSSRGANFATRILTMESKTSGAGPRDPIINDRRRYASRRCITQESESVSRFGIARFSRSSKKQKIALSETGESRSALSRSEKKSRRVNASVSSERRANKAEKRLESVKPRREQFVFARARPIAP